MVQEGGMVVLLGGCRIGMRCMVEGFAAVMTGCNNRWLPW